MRRKRSGGPLFTSVVGASFPNSNIPSPAEKMADQLARRDFIYLVVALALLGKVNWFLWMGAVGAPLCFLALAAFSLKNSPGGAATKRVPTLEENCDLQVSIWSLLLASSTEL
jgi:hypothetical protein